MFENFNRHRIDTGEPIINCVSEVGAAGPPAAWLPAVPGDVGARGAAAGREIHRGLRRSARLWRLIEAALPADKSTIPSAPWPRSGPAMKQLGFAKFHVVGHDRGGRTRIAWR